MSVAGGMLVDSERPALRESPVAPSVGPARAPGLAATARVAGRAARSAGGGSRSGAGRKSA